MLPRRFMHYHSLDVDFEGTYPEFLDLVKQAHIVIQQHRGPDIHENMMITNWALAYYLLISHACLGHSNGARMYRVEATTIVLDLGWCNWSLSVWEIDSTCWVVDGVSTSIEELEVCAR